MRPILSSNKSKVDERLIANQIFEFIASKGNEGITNGQIRSGLKLQRRTVKAALKRLIETGRIKYRMEQRVRMYYVKDDKSEEKKKKPLEVSSKKPEQSPGTDKSYQDILAWVRTHKGRLMGYDGD